MIPLLLNPSFDFSVAQFLNHLLTVWDYAKGNFSDLNFALYATPCEFIIMNSPNVDCTLLNISDVINQTLKILIATKMIHPSKRSKPWFNNKLKILIRKRSLLQTLA